MRDWADYGLAEWISGTPLVHGLKRARNIATERVFRSVPARGYDDFMAQLARLRPETVAVTIAYNKPWLIDIATQITRRNLVGTLVVCDNSRDAEARRAIGQICAERDVPYLALPFNLEHHPCRSHGIALNWVYYNVIDRARPRAFAFLDHDLFVTERLDLAALVANQPVYGRLNQSNWGWNLWAGLCVFDRAAIAQYAPDFNNDNPRLLDTGGRNWTQIYRHFDRSLIRFAESSERQIHLPGDGRAMTVEIFDKCLHVGGASTRDETADNINLEEACRRVARHLEAGGTIAELTVRPDTPSVA